MPNSQSVFKTGFQCHLSMRPLAPQPSPNPVPLPPRKVTYLLLCSLLHVCTLYGLLLVPPALRGQAPWSQLNLSELSHSFSTWELDGLWEDNVFPVSHSMRLPVEELHLFLLWFSFGVVIWNNFDEHGGTLWHSGDRGRRQALVTQRYCLKKKQIRSTDMYICIFVHINVFVHVYIFVVSRCLNLNPSLAAY